MRPQAVILDLDGTLVDTLGDFVAVLGLTLADLGLRAVGRDFVEHTIGRGSEHLMRTTLAAVGADPVLALLARSTRQLAAFRPSRAHVMRRSIPLSRHSSICSR